MDHLMDHLLPMDHHHMDHPHMDHPHMDHLLTDLPHLMVPIITATITTMDVIMGGLDDTVGDEETAKTDDVYTFLLFLVMDILMMMYVQLERTPVICTHFPFVLPELV